MPTLTPKRLSALLILMMALILLPAFLYTGYEFSRLSDSEEDLASVYGRQLDAVLFSVNQYAWDVTGGWLQTLNTVSPSISTPDRDSFPALDSLPPALLRQPSVLLAAVLDTQQVFMQVMARAPRDSISDLILQLRDSLSAHRHTLNRLLRLQESGYRKSEPLLLRPAGSATILALVSPATDMHGRQFFSLLCMESESFISSVLSVKLQEISGNEFVLTCTDASSGRVITSTGSETAGRALYQQRKLWLFPDYLIGIRLRGKTVEELARERFVANGLLFAAVDLLLVLGVWFVYRNLKRELQLAAMKTDFVSNVSHELKTPLALIRMYAETLEMGRITDAETQKEYHGIIVRETERLTRLINNILTFSRIESGKKRYHIAPTDLNGIVSDVMSLYRHHLEQRGFLASAETCAHLPRIDADEEAVAEALLNLIDNAMKYSTDEKQITVRTGSAEKEAWVEVEDRGMGIPEPLQKKVFEKFFRVSEGLVHTAKGSGLGLTLVQHIMNAHHGRIDLFSVPGEGSRFRLTFPVSDQHHRQSDGTHTGH